MGSPTAKEMEAKLVSLKISESEKVSGKISQENLESAISAMNKDGVVILEDAISLEHIRILREKMTEDTRKIMDQYGPGKRAYNFGSGHIMQDPPPTPEYLFQDVFYNDMAIPVVKHLLGDDCEMISYTSNTAFPGCTCGNAHSDVFFLWDDVVTPPCMIAINIYLEEATPENASTELWLGTHTNISYKNPRQYPRMVPEEAREKQMKISPPFQPTVKLGSLMIRDVRMWHRGMENKTQEPRHMMSMTYQTAWFKDPYAVYKEGFLKFPKSSESFISSGPVKVNAEFVEGEFDYLSEKEVADFVKDKIDPKTRTAAPLKS